MIFKVCPFCGKAAHLIHAHQDDEGRFHQAQIYCEHCDVIMLGESQKLTYDENGHLKGGWLTREELREYDEEIMKRWDNRRIKEQEHE